MRRAIEDSKRLKVLAVETAISREQPISLNQGVCSDEKIGQDSAPCTTL